MISPEMWQHVPDLITTLGSLYFLMAFTAKQRQWIIDRDEGKCQFPEPHECDIAHPQVHHITPQHYAATVFPKLNPDVSTNGITLCKNAHVGKDGVHPDTFQALQKYRSGEKSAFAQMAADRQQKLKGRTIYWVDKWDRIFHAKALMNDQLYVAKGHAWPEKKTHKKVEPEDNSLSRMKPLEVEMVES